MFSGKIWLYFSSVVAVIFILAPLSSADTISCSSDDMHRHYCSANTRRGVQLVKQRSDAKCIQGQTWGYDRKGIWVDRGCRADFSTGGSYGNGGYGNDGGYGDGDSQLVNCSSEDGHRHSCQINGNGGRVSLAKQRSGSPCVEGSTWGYNDREIWVDRGCRADFTVEARYDHGGHGGHGGHGDNGGGDADQFLNCSSEDGHRKYCPADTRGRVQMIKQRSGSECRQGYSWGFDRGGVWVDHGCRADFQIVK